MFVDILDDIGKTTQFFGLIFRTFLKKKLATREILLQIWNVFWESFPTTAMAGFFVGAILAVQFALQMKEFDALGYLGGLSTSGTFREVGPLLIAFMLSGKIGAYTSAELGTMRVTEQLDAIRCLGADPIQEIILPRFMGIILASFFLLTGGLFMSVLGGLLMGRVFAGVNPEEYLRHIPHILGLPSILGGVVKCFTFAFILATICTYRGYSASGGAKGVGRAVVATAVSTMICIVVMDWFTSFLSDIILRVANGY